MESRVRKTTSSMSWANRWDHLLARIGWKRSSHRVEPGLYAVGDPTPDSPVFVTANYTLSFDALRSALAGLHGYIMVLDTKSINVWCAAGKGTFGTDELVRRTEATQLRDVVQHRTMILPQLGASGVSAHEVTNRSGFKVEYGPVRAADLPQYLRTHRATPEMRKVRFGLSDRLILVPVEVVRGYLPIIVLLVIVGLLFRHSLGFSMAAALAAILAGVVLLPIFFPWIPTYDLSTKGFILGGAAALPFALRAVFWRNLDLALWQRIAGAISGMMLLIPVTAFIALNFTGATTFTSRTGVRREIFRYVPTMAWLFGSGVVLGTVLRLVRG